MGSHGSLFSIETPNWLLTKCYDALQQSPLKLDYMSAVEDWVLSGDLHQAHMQLQVPIGQAQLPSGQAMRPKVAFRTELMGTSIEMNNINLSIHALQGPLRFTSEQGLVSPQLTGRLWGEPIDIILGDYQQQENDIAYFPFQLDAATSVSAERLSQWLSLPILQWPMVRQLLK